MKNIISILASLIVGFFFGSAIKYGYEASTFKPYHWESPPKILNCYGDDLGASYITHAISFWETKGEKISGLIINPSEAECSDKYSNGFIIIRKASSGQLNYEVLAITHRNTSGLKINSAVIYFNPHNFKLINLMEHEIGHAIGYGHVETPGHIMNPEYEHMGSKFWMP